MKVGIETWVRKCFTRTTRRIPCSSELVTYEPVQLPVPRFAVWPQRRLSVSRVLVASLTASMLLLGVLYVVV